MAIRLRQTAPNNCRLTRADAPSPDRVSKNGLASGSEADHPAIGGRRFEPFARPRMIKV
jgi:hypothetical protein